MFRRTITSAARSPYALFLVKEKKHIKLQGLFGGARGKMAGKLFRNLPKSQLKELQAKAARLPQYKACPVKAAKKLAKARKMLKRAARAAKNIPLTKYNVFTRANIKKQPGDNLRLQMKQVAKLWQSKKQ